MAAGPVPYRPEPSLNPIGAPGGDYEHIESSPADFGGAIGAAQQRTGEEAVQAGAKGFDAAANWQDFYNKTTADDANNQYTAALTKIVHGDPNDQNDSGYLGKQGADAMSARKSVAQQIDDLRMQLRGNLHTDMSRLYFDQDSRRLQQFTLNTIGAHADQQMKTYALATAKAGTDNAIRAAANDPSDGNFEHQREVARQQEVQASQTQYGTAFNQALHDQAVSKADNAIITSTTIAKANTDPIAANAFLQAHRADLAPETLANLTNHLRTKLADTGAQQIISGGGGDYDTNVRKIENPGGDPTITNASGHMGNYQFSKEAWARWGNGGNPFNAADNLAAFKRKDVFERGELAKTLGRPATDGEAYLAHQQGLGGATALLTHPNMPAADALMTSGSYKTHDAAAAAISGNGGDPNASAGVFAAKWASRFGSGPSTNAAPPKDEAEAIQRGQDWAKSISPDVELQTSVVSAIKRNYTLNTQAGALQRDTLSQSVPTLMQGLEEGRDDIQFPSQQIAASMIGAPPAYQVKAAQWLKEADIAEKGGQMLKGSRWASTEEWQRNGADLASGKGVLSDMIKTHTKSGATGPGVTGATEEGADLTMAPRVTNSLYGIWNRLYTARGNALYGPQNTGAGNDPVAYIGDHPFVQEAFRGLDPKDPASAEAYINTLKTVQTQMGVPEEMQHVLTRDVALKMAGALTQTPDAKGAMDQLQKQYGKAWPSIFNDLVRMGKLPQSYQAVQALEDPGEAQLLAKAINDEKPGKDGKPAKSWGEELRAADGTLMGPKIKAQVESSTTIRDFHYSLTRSGMSAPQADEVVNAAVTLAYAHAVYEKTAPDVAARKAIDAFTGHYDLSTPGGARIPHAVFPAVTANMGATLDGLKPGDIQIPPNFSGGVHPGSQSYVDILRAAPNWITNKTETGVWLKDNQNRIVRGSNGKPLEVLFSTPKPVVAPQDSFGPIGQM